MIYIKGFRIRHIVSGGFWVLVFYMLLVMVTVKDLRFERYKTGYRITKGGRKGYEELIMKIFRVKCYGYIVGGEDGKS